MELILCVDGVSSGFSLDFRVLTPYSKGRGRMSDTMIDNLNSLLNSFNIKATCVDASQHRHFSYFDVELAHGTRISKITRYANELAVAMRAKSALIVTPIPEKGIVRLRTTHHEPDKIDFEEIYSQYLNSKPSGILPFLLGETDEGKPLWVDMANNPHLLVAGATGSGKSVFLHSLIANAIKRRDVKLNLVDTKLVEFSQYDIPFMSSVIRYFARSYSESVMVLERLIDIMEARYKYMAQHNLQSIEDCPNLFDKHLVIIDEVADLILQDKGKRYKPFENLVASLAQKARAAGIYLILATQRPSVNVLTGLIKSNFPARLACRVSTKTDSRVILDQQGAEHLAGKGDAIFKQPAGNTIRFQSAFVNPEQTIKELRRKSIEQNF